MFFFRRKLSSEELSHVKNMLEQAQNCAQAVNTTIDAEIFFYNLHQMLDLLLALRSYEKYKIFTGTAPSESYREIVSNIGKTVNAFIDRYVRSNPYYISHPLLYYFDQAHTFWPGVYFLWPDCPNYQHYRGPLYTKANYKRAKSVTQTIPKFTVNYDLLPAEKALFAEISKANAEGKDISPDQYMQLREFQEAWLERNYDFNSLEGIESIPVSVDLPGAPGGHTGMVYYYLRHKAYLYEDAGNRELALACMRKSVALVMCTDFRRIDDCYPLVRMLARFGFADEAFKAKQEFDAIFDIKEIDNSMIYYELSIWKDWQIVQWLQDSFPGKGPKTVSGYRRMKTQNTKNYQQLKALAAQKGKEI